MVPKTLVMSLPGTVATPLEVSMMLVTNLPWHSGDGDFDRSKGP